MTQAQARRPGADAMKKENTHSDMMDLVSGAGGRGGGGWSWA